MSVVREMDLTTDTQGMKGHVHSATQWQPRARNSALLIPHSEFFLCAQAQKTRVCRGRPDQVHKEERPPGKFQCARHDVSTFSTLGLALTWSLGAAAMRTTDSGGRSGHELTGAKKENVLESLWF